MRINAAFTGTDRHRSRNRTGPNGPVVRQATGPSMLVATIGCLLAFEVSGQAFAQPSNDQQPSRPQSRAQLLHVQQSQAQQPHAPQPPAGDAGPVVRVREVIEAQLQAFLADDAPRAFSFAAPGIQMRFENPERFVAMVRSTYPAVYRPARYRFLQAENAGDAVLQPVSIEDGDGRGWVAVYLLTRQPDASWRIEGCQLSPERGSRT